MINEMILESPFPSNILQLMGIFRELGAWAFLSVAQTNEHSRCLMTKVNDVGNIK